MHGSAQFLAAGKHAVFELVCDIPLSRHCHKGLAKALSTNPESYGCGVKRVCCENARTPYHRNCSVAWVDYKACEIGACCSNNLLLFCE